MAKILELIDPKIVKQPVYLACSGGVDSVVLFHILTKLKTDFEVIFFNHGDEDDDQQFVRNLCDTHGIKLHIGSFRGYKGPSMEEKWRVARYNFIDMFNDRPVLLAHTLDDVLETYTMSFETGNPKIIEYKRKNCIRPLLSLRKSTVIEYAQHHGIQWHESPANSDKRFKRIQTRNDIVPLLLSMFPSLPSTLRKHILNRDRPTH